MLYIFDYGKENFSTLKLNSMEILMNVSKPEQLKDAILTFDNFFEQKNITLDKFFKPTEKEIPKPPVEKKEEFFIWTLLSWVFSVILVIILIVCLYWYWVKRRERLRRKRIERDKNYIYDVEDY